MVRRRSRVRIPVVARLERAWRDSSAWSERTAHNREVPGSSPGPATTTQIKQQRGRNFYYELYGYGWLCCWEMRASVSLCRQRKLGRMLPQPKMAIIALCPSSRSNILKRFSSSRPFNARPRRRPRCCSGGLLARLQRSYRLSRRSEIHYMASSNHD